MDIGLAVSMVLNGLFAAACFFLVVQVKGARGQILRKDGFIRHTKERLRDAEDEINRKEGVIRTEKAKGRRLSVTYFAEEQVDKGFFRDDHIVSFKCQLMIDAIPVGAPIMMQKNEYREVDKDNVNQILESFAKPLLEAGAEVAVRKLR